MSVQTIKQLNPNVNISWDSAYIILKSSYTQTKQIIMEEINKKLHKFVN